MSFKDMRPTVSDIKERQEQTGCGAIEASKNIFRERLIAWLEKPNANYSMWDLQQVLIVVLKNEI